MYRNVSSPKVKGMPKMNSSQSPHQPHGNRNSTSVLYSIYYIGELCGLQTTRHIIRTIRNDTQLSNISTASGISHTEFRATIDEMRRRNAALQALDMSEAIAFRILVKNVYL